MADNQMSFLPEDYVERRIEQRTNLLCLTLFGVVLVAVVGAYTVTSRHRAEVRANREQVNRAYTEAARRIEQLDQLRGQREEMLRKASTTRTLVEPVPRTFLLADLVNRMPSTLSLLELSLSTKTEAVRVAKVDKSKSALANGKPAPGDKKAPPEKPPTRTLVTVGLIGVAPTDVQVAQFMAGLAQSGVVGDVNLVFSEEARIQESPMRKFRIDMTLREDADVRHLDPLLVPRKLKADPMKRQSLEASAPTEGGVSSLLNMLKTSANPAAKD